MEKEAEKMKKDYQHQICGAMRELRDGKPIQAYEILQKLLEEHVKDLRRPT